MSKATTALTQIADPVREIADIIARLLVTIATLVVAALLADTMLGQIGFDIPEIRGLTIEQTTYACGAIWLIRARL